MATASQRWRDALPTWLRPRGVRYLAATAEQPAILSNKRIFILPTKQGAAFFAILGLMLLGAMNYSNSMAFVLTFWLGSVSLISLLYTYRNLIKLEIKPAGAEPCFAGGHAVFNLLLNNPQSRQRFDVEIQNATGISNVGSINSDDHTLISLAIPAAQRGRLPLGRITLASRYPLGLFRAWAYVDVESETLVYPRPANHAPLPQTGQGSGDRVETTEEGSDDFHGFRQYHAGDSPRHIYWKALARERGLITKQFQRHQSPELWFDWDDTRGGNIEIRLSQLCRWLLDADSQQRRFGLRLPGVVLPPAQGKEQLALCLAQLALFGEAA
ncbi:MAG TPA: DUF58 domain-containing protein [Candidatus Tenderia electrophaga]|uniref:DUF58 domain-containing protein n=1 Tax=Candidatus Tenderia electrophaga TaxID=1748243 RepID=A0A832N3C3_9GAMM|nr:DUF58 domain-containing protein [Candidatus Tenderia electrophaga]